MNDLSRRILDISYKKHLAHIGSCLTALPIIDDIYSKMYTSDRFVLSSGHAGLALYCVLEKYLGKNAEMLFDKHGVHPNRDEENGIWVSSGSLGHGLPIALGMALSDQTRKIYCLISDGECAEGSIWEALRVKVDNHVDNLEIHLSMNGFGAYDPIDPKKLTKRIKAFDPSVIIHNSVGSVNQLAHYKIMTGEEYAQIIL